MSEQPDQDQKTEEPTPKRREDAAKRGDMWRSRDLLSAAVMISGAAYLAMMGPVMVEALGGVMRDGLTFDRSTLDAFEPDRRTWALVWPLAPSIAGILLVTAAAAIGAQAMLGSLRFSAESLAPKGSRIDPLAGLKRMFGAHGLGELAKATVKVVLVGAIGVWLLGEYAERLTNLSRAEFASAIADAGDLVGWLFLLMAGSLALVAILDVPLEYWRWMGRLRMSRQEVRDEAKEQDGSPELKSAMRRRQRDLVRNSVRGGVGQAHVVLTNPTHFAVALRYDRARDRAPVVVARGKGLIAEAIRELARERRISLVESPALARALYFTSRTGQEIREELYTAVAAIVAFVFSLERSETPPRVDVPAEFRFDERGQVLR